MNTTPLRIAFFGGEPLGVPTLTVLKEHGIIPALVVCNPDKVQGREMKRTSPAVKLWAQENDIEVFQPESLIDETTKHKFKSEDWDLFIVVAYGAIMPQWLIEVPKYKTINLHPSLLPLLRGASPIRTALLEDMQTTGVSIMLMDEKMDHGPLLAQKEVHIESSVWPIKGRELDAVLAQEGAALLSKSIPQWVEGTITPIEQDHTKATFSKKISKADGEVSIDSYSLPTGNNAYAIYLKICAYDGWPGTFFFYQGKRIKITEASFQNDMLVIEKVTPEGKSSVSFENFITNL